MIETASIPKGHQADRIHHAADQARRGFALCGLRLDNRYQYGFVDPAEIERGWPPFCGRCREALGRER